LKKQYTILIADRNPNVRELLKREFSAMSEYRIMLAKNGYEVLKLIYDPEPLDLVILDLGLPDENGLRLLQKIQDRIPTLPVIVHSFFADYACHPSVAPSTSFVEKTGDSVEILKRVTADILRKRELQRSRSMAASGKDQTES